MPEIQFENQCRQIGLQYRRRPSHAVQTWQVTSPLNMQIVSTYEILIQPNMLTRTASLGPLVQPGRRTTPCTECGLRFRIRIIQSGLVRGETESPEEGSPGGGGHAGPLPD